MKRALVIGEICIWGLLSAGLASSATGQDASRHGCREVIVVAPDGSGDYPTIQEAIDAALDGDIIELTNGCFTGDGNRDIDFLGKAITVRSQGGDPMLCTIACHGNPEEPHRGFSFQSGEGPESVLRGIGITAGYAMHGGWPQGNGGGLFCEASSPTIDNCVITGCTAAWEGGGLWSWDGSPAITNCLFEWNVASGGGGGLWAQSDTLVVTDCHFRNNLVEEGEEGGGGIGCEECLLTLTGCRFSDNTAPWAGGLGCRFGEATLTTCTFAENQATGQFGGGGLLVLDCSATVTNCTFFRNSTPEAGGGIACWGNASPVIWNTIIAFGLEGEPVWCDGGATPTLICCDIYGNTAGDWIGCIEDQYEIEGNISVHPRFCDPRNGDFTLQASSPCAPFSPPNEECDLIGAWPVGCDAQFACGDLVWEIDPCEFCGQDAFFETTYTEMTHDCIVDEIDYTLFMAEFGQTGEGLSGDFNGDGVVDVFDWAAIANDFGQDVEPCEQCGVPQDSCRGRIRISFSPDLTDIDRIDIPPGVLGTAYVVAERCSLLMSVHMIVYASPNISIECIDSAPDGVWTGSGVSFWSLWPDDSTRFMATVDFIALDASPGMIGVRGETEYPDIRYLNWAQFLSPWPPEHPSSEIRRMGFNVISYGGINGDPPPDSLGWGFSSAPDEEGRGSARTELHLVVSAPNPLSTTGSISYAIPDGVGGVLVSLGLYDSAGRLVRRLVDAYQPGGVYNVSWDAADETGWPLQGGVYFCRLRVGQETRTTRVVVVR